MNWDDIQHHLEPDNIGTAPTAIKNNGCAKATRRSAASYPSIPTAAVWPTASRSARPVCGKSTRSVCNCAAKAASGKYRTSPKPAIPTFTGRRV